MNFSNICTDIISSKLLSKLANLNSNNAKTMHDPMSQTNTFQHKFDDKLMNDNIADDNCIVHHLWSCGEWTSSKQPIYACYWQRFSGFGSFCPNLTIIEPQSIQHSITLSHLTNMFSKLPVISIFFF